MVFKKIIFQNSLMANVTEKRVVEMTVKRVKVMQAAPILVADVMSRRLAAILHQMRMKSIRKVNGLQEMICLQ